MLTSDRASGLTFNALPFRRGPVLAVAWNGWFGQVAPGALR